MTMKHVFKSTMLSAFIQTKTALWSCYATSPDGERYFAVGESEDHERIIVEALSEQTAMFRLAQKLNGILYFISKEKVLWYQ